MRTHRKHTAFTVPANLQAIAQNVRLQHLAAARLEPIVRGLRGGCMLDLLFHAADAVAVVPFIEIAPEMLVQREMSPFVWPESIARSLTNEAADDLERALLPWIESLTLARQLNAETMRFFGEARSRDLFYSAREAGFLGAAPYAGVLQDAAPYVYAARFAENARVAIADARGGFGAALLSRHAREVRADLGSAERNELAARWFALPSFGEADRAVRYDLAVRGEDAPAFDAGVRVLLDAAAQAAGARIEVAHPVPTDVMVSFDPGDAPVCRTFYVDANLPAAMRTPFVEAAPRSTGGSSGRILLLLRNDFARVPDADSDHAHALAGLLRGEGFTVDLAAASTAVPAAYDLVHAFTLARVDELAAPLGAARSAGVPIVISPFLEDVSAQGAWGTGIVRALLRVSLDETDLEDSLALVAQRRLDAAGLSAKRQEPFPGYEQSVRAAFQHAGAVIVSGEQEQDLVRAFGYGGPVVRAGPPLSSGEPAGLEAVAGTGDFALVHAPLEARSNLLLLVRAAAAARVPLIVAGPLVEPEYLLAAREQAGERVVFLPEPACGAAEALYRRARVYADVSWVRFGTYRTLRAAAYGAAIVAASGSHARGLLGAEGVWEADPASEASIALALRDAWMHARERRPAIDGAGRRAAALGEARAALVAVAGAYAQAQQARAHA